MRRIAEVQPTRRQARRRTHDRLDYWQGTVGRSLRAGPSRLHGRTPAPTVIASREAVMTAIVFFSMKLSFCTKISILVPLLI